MILAIFYVCIMDGCNLALFYHTQHAFKMRTWPVDTATAGADQKVFIFRKDEGRDKVTDARFCNFSDFDIAD